MCILPTKWVHVHMDKENGFGYQEKRHEKEGNKEKRKFLVMGLKC